MGMDADPAMVTQARKQFPEQTFIQKDVRNFELDEPVDVVFSNAALHWIPPCDVDRAVASMAAALKPGGRFIVEFGGKDNVELIVRATLQVLDLPESASPWYFPSIANFTSILERHDMGVTTALLFDRPTPLEEGEDGLSNWLRMFGNKFFQDLSRDEVERVWFGSTTSYDRFCLMVRSGPLIIVVYGSLDERKEFSPDNKDISSEYVLWLRGVEAVR
jgi:SAM-dependent methyltransferase